MTPEKVQAILGKAIKFSFSLNIAALKEVAISVIKIDFPNSVTQLYSK